MRGIVSFFSRVGPSFSGLDLPAAGWPFLLWSWPFLLWVWPFLLWVPSFSGSSFSRELAFPSAGLPFPVSGLALPSRGWLFFFGEVGPSFLGFGPSLSSVLTLEEVNCGITREPLTPKVFFPNHIFKSNINLIFLLTLVKVESGIARDAFTQKVALSAT